MTLRARLLVVLLLAAGLPVVLLGVFSYRASRAQLADTLGRMQLQSAQDLARGASGHVFQAVENLRLAASYLPLEQLQPSEVGPVLGIPFRQIRPLNLVAVVDRAGQAVAPAVYAPGEGSGRDVMDADALTAFSKNVPVGAAFDTGAAIGRPYRSTGRAARVAVAVRPQTDGERMLVGEISLEELQRRVEELARDGARAFVVDAQGTPVADSGAHALSDDERAFVVSALRDGATRVERLRGGDGAEYLATFAPMHDLAWGAVVERPVAVAFAPAEFVKKTTAYWAAIAALLAAGLGLILARGVSEPVAQLSAAAKRMAQGEYEQTVPATGRDELAQLGATFNQMAQEIRRRDVEIRGFNEVLQQRVEQKTRELKEAQDQIERTRRVAALGTFAAGFTHELNNPLTGIIGLATILDSELRETPNGEMTAMLLKESRRMTRVIAELRAIVDEQQQSAGVRFDVQRSIRAAVEAQRARAEARAVAIELELSESPLEVQGDPDQLRKLFDHLAQNAVNAMPQGGRLTISAVAVGTEAVRITVRDTGKGIPAELHERIFDPFFTTKDDPTSVGLGLSVSQKIVEAHHGRIRVDSEPGRGATFTVTLPAAAGAAHLY